MDSKIKESIFERSENENQYETGIDLRMAEEKKRMKEGNMNTQKIDNGIVKIILDLVVAAKEGRLDTRADLGGVTGTDRDLLKGVNELIDSVVGPLNVAAEYVDRISKGDIPHKITDSYNGDFNKIKNNLNLCIDSINLLVVDTNLLSAAAVEGKLATRADAEKHQGEFKNIVVGVNNTLDSVVGPLNVAAEYVDRISKGDIPHKITDSYNGDFNEIKNNLNLCIDSINQLVADANLLAVAAVEGKLETRADAGKHQGDFRNIVVGVNNTLDSVVVPMNVAAEHMERISKGDIPHKITDSYNGDFNKIMSNLNMLIESMNNITDAAEQIAKGNLTIKIKERSSQDRLLQAISKMIDELTNVAESIQSASEQVAAGSLQLSSGSQQLSQGANEQASSIEEVSSSMTQMASNINQNADNAQQTNNIALKASEDAKKSGEAVEEAVIAMKGIVEKISIISDIAGQTNMLALNAAIEAARVGEQGKGFAVVAAEVRKLAERSQSSANEIDQLSSSSMKKAEKAGEMLMKLVPDIQKTADLVDEISSASLEQKSGADQINLALQQLDLVIQQNASASEETAATSEELTSQAEMLQDTAAFFTIENRNRIGRTRKQNYRQMTGRKPVLPKPTRKEDMNMVWSNEDMEGSELEFKQY